MAFKSFQKFEAAKEPLSTFIPITYVYQLHYSQVEMEKMAENLVSHKQDKECTIFAYEFENVAARAYLKFFIRVAPRANPPRAGGQVEFNCQLTVNIENS